MSFDVAARLLSAVLWVAVEFRYITDVVAQRHQAARGQHIVQTGLGALFILIAFSAVRAVWVGLQPSWLTYAFPAAALVMVVGQHWEWLSSRLRRFKP